MMGKGSNRRPRQVERQEFEDNWEYIFKREKKNDSVMKHKRKPKDVNEQND